MNYKKSFFIRFKENDIKNKTDGLKHIRIMKYDHHFFKYFHVWIVDIRIIYNKI